MNIVPPVDPPELRYVKVGIHPVNPNCMLSGLTPEQTKELEKFLNTKQKICAGYPFQRADHGDSGGPLLYRRNGVIYQIGVVEVGLTVDKLGMFMINPEGFESLMAFIYLIFSHVYPSFILLRLD